MLQCGVVYDVLYACVVGACVWKIGCVAIASLLISCRGRADIKYRIICDHFGGGKGIPLPSHVLHIKC